MVEEQTVLLEQIRDGITSLHEHMEEDMLFHTVTVDTHMFLGLLAGVRSKKLGELFTYSDTVAIPAGETKTVTFTNPPNRYRFVWMWRFDSEVSNKIQADIFMDGGIQGRIPHITLKYLCPAFRTDLHTPMHAHNVPVTNEIKCVFTNNDGAERWAMIYVNGIQTTPEVYNALLKVHILGFLKRIELTYGELPGK